MQNTKIDWCESSWNPVTGCLHKCKYCYARGIATRFSGKLPIPECNSIIELISVALIMDRIIILKDLPAAVKLLLLVYQL